MRVSSEAHGSPPSNPTHGTEKPGVLTQGSDQKAEVPAATQPYSIFSLPRKRWMVFIVAMAGWLSTLSSFIYFPAITALAESLNVSISKIDLSVTTYLVVSAVAPAISGDLADGSGRRPVFMAMLVVYIAANIGLALQRSYVALLLLRMLQSAGISGTFALAYGVVADIASPAERGGYIGLVSFGTNTAPAFGPLIGTLLLAFRGWGSIFWFLTVLATICLILVVFILPETAREVVGNGGIEPPKFYRLPFVAPVSQKSAEKKQGEKVRIKLPNPLTCLYRLWDKDNAIVILTISILYMALNCLQASLSSLFIDLYDFNNLQAGLAYLPFGVSSSIFAFLAGKTLDTSFRSTARAINFPTDRSVAVNLLSFPISRARIRLLPFPLAIAIAAIIGYGWALQTRIHVAVPLVLQFIMGAGIQSCFTMLNTLLVDLNNDAPATAQASCNILRCAFAGLGTAVLHRIIDSIGVGWYFTILGFACATPAPFLALQWQYSVKWRKSKAERSP